MFYLQFSEMNASFYRHYSDRTKEFSINIKTMIVTKRSWNDNDEIDADNFIVQS